jgi:hypothetical protein
MITVFRWVWVTRLTDVRCPLLTAADKISRDSRYLVGAQTGTWSGDIRTSTTRCMKRWRTSWSWVIQADQVWFCSRIAEPSARLFWDANMHNSCGWKRILPSAGWRATCLCGWRKKDMILTPSSDRERKLPSPYIHTCMHRYIYIHAYIHIHTYIHTYIHTHTHTQTQHMKFTTDNIKFYCFFHTLLVLLCFVVYMVVCYVCFYLILYIMHSFCYVYVFLLLCMFCSR